MKKKKLLLSLTVLSVVYLHAQEMPSVFNKSLSNKGNVYKKVLVLGDSETIYAIGGGHEGIITKSSGQGEVQYNKALSKGGVVCYNDITTDKEGNLVVAGGGTIAVGNARLSKLNNKGEFIFDKSIGQNTGGYFTRVIADSMNNYIAVGTDGSKPSRARIVKFNNRGDILFDKAFGTHNVFLDAAIDEDGNIIATGGDIGDMEGRARITKLNPSGDIIFDEELARTGASFTKVVLLSGNNILVVGGGAYGTGNPCRISKIRGEDGQIIYDKAYSTADGRFSDVYVNEDGGVVACAEEYEQGRIVRLRPDGTEIYNQAFSGALHALKMSVSGEVVAVGEFNKTQGKLIKLRSDGGVQYDKVTDQPMKQMILTEDGEIYSLGAHGYSLLKYSPSGDLMFTKNFGNYGSSSFEVLEQTPSGQVIAGGGGLDDGGRLAKITHGLIINDIVVSEPINGTSTATLSVSLTGFLRRKGIRSPVTVNYKTKEGTAKSGVDYVEADGALFFVPSDYVVGMPITQSIQVPLQSDNQLEGKETFQVELSKAENAYITKGNGEVTVIDQPAILKFIGGTDGAEQGLQPINYYAGIYKQDNTPLVNKTGSNIKIDYTFGNGSATGGTDYLASTRAPFIIADGSSEGTLQVKVKDDNNYELKKSVIVQIGGARSANESIVSFEGGAAGISHAQYIKDQPAFLSVIKLADRSRTITAPSSIFKIMLTKADGTILTNCTGDDVQVTFGVDESSTAVLGKDYAILEGDMVKLAGGCDKGEVDLKAVTINTHKQEEDKTVVIKLIKATGPNDAGILSIDNSKDKASVIIKGK